LFALTWTIHNTLKNILSNQNRYLYLLSTIYPQTYPQLFQAKEEGYKYFVVGELSVCFPHHTRPSPNQRLRRFEVQTSGFDNIVSTLLSSIISISDELVLKSIAKIALYLI